MKRIWTVLGGLAAALVASSVQAGDLAVMYWGSDQNGVIAVDGYAYDLRDNPTVTDIYAGSHNVTLSIAGRSYSEQVYLTDEGATIWEETGRPIWCLDVMDNGDIRVPPAYDCQEALWEGF
jgi:hypothetical protein